jgi:hypothetical protein
MSSEWVWAIAICAIPFLAFAAFELASLLRRRRFEAIARRPKARDLGRG